MASPPSTHASLLVRLTDPADADAWSRFVALYRDFVVGYARGCSLQPADAEDVWQEVLTALHRRLHDEKSPFRYDADGSFSGWLRKVTLSKIRDKARKAKRSPEALGGSDAQVRFAELPGPEEDAAFEREHVAYLVRKVAEKARRDFLQDTFDTFWCVCIEGEDAEAVAARLGVAVALVHLRKNKVTRRIREIVRELGTLEGGRP